MVHGSRFTQRKEEMRMDLDWLREIEICLIHGSHGLWYMARKEVLNFWESVVFYLAVLFFAFRKCCFLRPEKARFLYFGSPVHGSQGKKSFFAIFFRYLLDMAGQPINQAKKSMCIATCQIIVGKILHHFTHLLINWWCLDF